MSLRYICNCDSGNIYDKSYVAISFHEVAAVTVGQNFGTVVVSVYAQYLKRSPTEKLLELSGYLTKGSKCHAKQLQ